MRLTHTSLSEIECILQPSQIDIWQFGLDKEINRAFDLLSTDEQTRAKRYHFSRHQRRFTMARAVTRVILARYIQLPPDQLKFTYLKHGKPQLAHPLSIEFNISHSSDLALLAIGQQLPMGIDVEFFSARPYEGIGEHLFSPFENKALKKAPSTLKPLTFFHIWAQKEAFIKASGLGLAYPTQTFDVPCSPPTTQPIYDSLHHQTWKIVSFMPKIACSAALCYHPSIKIIRYIQLGQKELLSLL